MLFVKTSIGPSEINGTGLFADEFIPEGTRYWQITEGFDLKVSRTIIDLLPEASREQMLKYCYVDMDTRLVVICMDNTRHTNHSDTPNTREVHRKGLPAYAITTRDIEPGEEITTDYRTFDAAWREKLGPNWPALGKRREKALATA